MRAPASISAGEGSQNEIHAHAHTDGHSGEPECQSSFVFTPHEDPDARARTDKAAHMLTTRWSVSLSLAFITREWRPWSVSPWTMTG